MTRRLVMMAAAALAMAPAAARAQNEACTEIVTPPASATECNVAVDVLRAAYAQTGILAAGGNPVPGVESTRGITLMLVPGTTASLRFSAARQQLPDLRSASAGEERGEVATAIRLGTATKVFGGVAAGPVSGVGSIDLLLDAALLPAAGQGRDAAAAFGAGARIGLIRETFATPGVGVTAMYRHVGRQQYGRLCPIPDVSCADSNVGEASFGVNDVSGRLTVGKRLGPVGLLGGVGIDRFSTSHGLVRFYGGGVEGTARLAAEVDRHDTRWSAFGNLSYGLLVGSLVAEAGYMGGGEASLVFDGDVGGYKAGKGTPFGSLALRITL